MTIFQRVWPSARAAVTKGSALSASTWPRTMRAMVSHSIMPSAMIRITIFV